MGDLVSDVDSDVWGGDQPLAAGVTWMRNFRV